MYFIYNYYECYVNVKRWMENNKICLKVGIEWK